MPPSQTDPACRTFDPPDLLPAEELGAIADWASAGFPIGSFPPADEDESRPANFIAGPVHIELPPGSERDLWYCVPLGRTPSVPIDASGVRLISSTPGVVHHFSLRIGDQSSPCETAGPEIFAGALGGDEIRLPSGFVQYIPANSEVVAALHLSAETAPQSSLPQELTLSAAFWTEPLQQSERVIIAPLKVSDFMIPAGANHVVVSGTAAADADYEFLGAFPHMHFLGVRASAWIERVDGGSDCLVDAPRFEFLQQRWYLFPAADRVRVAPGDLVHVECTFDNSAANQPVLRGARREPIDVSDGDRSVDEMCEVVLLAVPR